MKAPSMNALVPMSIALTDATGSAADLVRVSVRRVAA
jgi:phenylacetyl-CoA:acceptor oxidoreductase